MSERQKVLFVCTQNSARSQMAEGILKKFHGNRFEVFSAGSEPSKVNPYAIQVMAEIAIDISRHRSKSIDEFSGMDFDYVITVCDRAKETCPYFPGARTYIHCGFEDPAALKGVDESILNRFRHIRDEITAWIRKTFERGTVPSRNE
jgi:arsenate reductase